jgi:hypothetical protein
VAVHDARIVDQNQVIAYAVQRAKSSGTDFALSAQHRL